MALETLQMLLRKPLMSSPQYGNIHVHERAKFSGTHNLEWTHPQRILRRFKTRH